MIDELNLQSRGGLRAEKNPRVRLDEKLFAVVADRSRAGRIASFLHAD